MRTISAALEAHVAQETTSLATIWKVTRVDGQIFGFTDHDRDLVVSSVTYAAATGYTRSAARATLGMEPDNLEVQGVLDSSALDADDIRAGVWDYATVEVMLANWADLTQGTLILGKGRIGPIKAGRSSFVAELFGLAKHLGQSIGRLYSAACDADLGDARCAFNLAQPGFTITGSITAVTSTRVFTDSALAQATGFFDYGKITWTSGLNLGLSMEVKTFTSPGSIALQLPMPYAVQAGDTYSMSAGCDKTFATCGSKFVNSVNFQGFPHIPGNKRLLTGGL